jgi:Cu/Ag efflux pump CusA
MDEFCLSSQMAGEALSTLIFVGKIHSEENHPISKPMMKIYHPVVEFVLDHKWLTICGALLVMGLSIPVLFQARLGVHAATRRRYAPLYAFNAAWHLCY